MTASQSRLGPLRAFVPSFLAISRALAHLAITRPAMSQYQPTENQTHHVTARKSGPPSRSWHVSPLDGPLWRATTNSERSIFQPVGISAMLSKQRECVPEPSVSPLQSAFSIFQAAA